MAEQKEYEYCLRCGRKLKSKENRMRGMGKRCWEKSQDSLGQKPLFDVHKKLPKISK